MVRAVLDHLVVAAATLEQGENHIESRLGARPLRGGKHVAMGTHNGRAFVREQLDSIARQTVRLQIYGHLLPSSSDVVEWVKGTLLTDYERQIDAARFGEFVDAYRARLLKVIGDARPYFYTYRRDLMWAEF